MENNLLKQIEENTRRTSLYLGFFVIVSVVGFALGVVYLISNNV